MENKSIEVYYTDYPSVSIGRRNPYYCCAHCGVSDPQINGRLEGHLPDCKWVINKIKEIQQNETTRRDH